MTLSTDWEVEQTWGSHQPLLAGVLEVLKPQSAVECGCGNYSTPRLRACVNKLTTVEHDGPWSSRIRRKFPGGPVHSWIVYPFNANNATPHAQLKPAEAEALDRFYQELRDSLSPFSLLFVDTYRCARVVAARTLCEKASMLILHDVEPASIPFYGYEQLDGVLKGWHKYVHKPMGTVARTHQIAWTALYTREGLLPEQLEQLQGPVVRESVRLWGMKVGVEKADG